MEEYKGSSASEAEKPATKGKRKSRQRAKGREPSYGAAVAVPARADRPAGVDALDRSHYVRALAALIMNSNTEVPLTIGIYGRWGSGKSSFMEQLRRQLTAARHDVVDFNPWRYTDAQHILIGLIRAIAGPLDRQMRILSRIRFLFDRSFLSQFAKFQKRVSAASKKIGNWVTTVLGGLGIWSSIPTPSDPVAEPGLLENIGEFLRDTNVTDWLNEMGLMPQIVQANLSGVLIAIVGLVLLYKFINTMRRPFATQFEAYLGSFKTGREEIRELTRDDLTKISEIIGGYTAKNTRRHRPPIVIFLDDLDRCPPDSIVEVLEAINLFLTNLPFITVFGLDSQVVTQAVAERYHFMLEKDPDQRDREEYGRFFLEKIINIPFQLPTPRSFDSYIDILIRRRDVEKEEEEEEASKIRRKRIPVSFALEALRQRNDLVVILMFPLYLYLDLLSKLAGAFARDEDHRWMISIQSRLYFNLPFTDEQNEWIEKQSYRRREFVRNLEVMTGRRRIFTVFFNPYMVIKAAREADNAALAREVEIQAEDSELLQRFATDVRGNPRSVKRFINTYQLTKGIRSELALHNDNLPGLESLAAWLVILQNWPYEGSTLYSRVEENPTLKQPRWTAPIGKNPLPSDMVSFINKNFDDLRGLKTATTGFEIPGCFSFMVPDYTAEPMNTDGE